VPRINDLNIPQVSSFSKAFSRKMTTFHFSCCVLSTCFWVYNHTSPFKHRSTVLQVREKGGGPSTGPQWWFGPEEMGRWWWLGCVDWRLKRISSINGSVGFDWGFVREDDGLLVVDGVVVVTFFRWKRWERLIWWLFVNCFWK